VATAFRTGAGARRPGVKRAGPASFGARAESGADLVSGVPERCVWVAALSTLEATRTVIATPAAATPARRARSGWRRNIAAMPGARGSTAASGVGVGLVRASAGAACFGLYGPAGMDPPSSGN
jgi:hypothetical protein